MVISTSNGSYWGELLATASHYRGAVGMVADVYVLDTGRRIEMQFPTFVAGILACDSLRRIDIDQVGVPVECENLVREKLAEGMPVREAFRTYGVI